MIFTNVYKFHYQWIISVEKKFVLRFWFTCQVLPRISFPHLDWGWKETSALVIQECYLLVDYYGFIYKTMYEWLPFFLFHPFRLCYMLDWLEESEAATQKACLTWVRWMVWGNWWPDKQTMSSNISNDYRGKRNTSRPLTSVHHWRLWAKDVYRARTFVYRAIDAHWPVARSWHVCHISPKNFHPSALLGGVSFQ